LTLKCVHLNFILVNYETREHLLQLDDGEVAVFGEVELWLPLDFLLVTAGQHIHHHKVSPCDLQEVQHLKLNETHFNPGKPIQNYH